MENFPFDQLYSDPQWVGCEETKPPTDPLTVQK